VTLLEQVGLYDPARPLGDVTVESPAGLCIFPAGGGAPVFSSTHPLDTVALAVDFARYTQLARKAVLSQMPWETTVGAWIRGLPLSEAFKARIAYPWTAALIGSARGDALQASARSILQTFALSFPADLTRGATTFNSAIGLQGNLQRVLDRCSGVHVHVDSAVTALARERAGWFVTVGGRRRGPYRHVVLNAPASAGRALLPSEPAFARVRALLGEYRYFGSRVLIHTDPAYMAADRTDWASYNAGVQGADCEGSVWYGALRPPLPSGATVDVFKSWASRRHVRPEHVLLRRDYRHPLNDRAMIRAARGLAPLQGRDGLYFSGQYTTGFDSQESAVYSAMRVAARLAPHSRTLVSLKGLLRARGRAGISYEL
jgi:uncharacterized protein